MYITGAVEGLLLWLGNIVEDLYISAEAAKPIMYPPLPQMKF